MSLTYHDNMVSALAVDRSDQPFDDFAREIWADRLVSDAIVRSWRVTRVP
jgi:hypothetical protein